MGKASDISKIEEAMLLAQKTDFAFVIENFSASSNALIAMLKQRKLIANNYFAKTSEADKEILIEYFIEANKSICQIMGIVV